MKTIAKRIAGAALAVGLIGGAGIVGAAPAQAEVIDRFYSSKKTCQIHFADLRLSLDMQCVSYTILRNCDYVVDTSGPTPIYGYEWMIRR